MDCLFAKSVYFLQMTVWRHLIGPNIPSVINPDLRLQMPFFRTQLRLFKQLKTLKVRREKSDHKTIQWSFYMFLLCLAKQNNGFVGSQTVTDQVVLIAIMIHFHSVLFPAVTIGQLHLVSCNRAFFFSPYVSEHIKCNLRLH